MKVYAALLLAVLALLSLASAAPRDKRQWGPGYGPGYRGGFGGRGYGPGYGNRYGPGGRWGGRPTVIEKTVIIRPGK